ncbi:hypothetical protein Tsubulata_045687 [Turnera subulata]|uniref:CCHC-type domain-containing protein n=1 Tax=Turnera subulata TaxID=218843 RepID=A0A9Q0J495_9ROSI|nr:hypothetical protein Tsubulata_045687 [Turnera subulata]
MASTKQSSEGEVERVPGTQIDVVSDAEEEVLELEVVGSDQQIQPRLSLIARVLGTKHVNPQAFSNLMGKIWNPRKGIEAEQLGRNLFLFHFFSKRDRQEVMEAETPWFFEKRIVVLKEVTGDEVLTQMELTEVPIWIQMHNIPWNQRTYTNVTNIAAKAGRFLAFDDRGAQGWGKFVRARVLMHVEKSIRKSILIRSGMGEKVEVLYRYEGLPNFCYLCGKMDHLLKECEQRTEDSDEEERTIYGEWLRASPRKPFRLRTIGHAPTKPEAARKLAYKDLDTPLSGVTIEGPAQQKKKDKERVSSLDENSIRNLVLGSTESPPTQAMQLTPLPPTTNQQQEMGIFSMGAAVQGQGKKGKRKTTKSHGSKGDDQKGVVTRPATAIIDGQLGDLPGNTLGVSDHGKQAEFEYTQSSALASNSRSTAGFTRSTWKRLARAGGTTPTGRLLEEGKKRKEWGEDCEEMEWEGGSKVGCKKHAHWVNKGVPRHDVTNLVEGRGVVGCGAQIQTGLGGGTLQQNRGDRSDFVTGLRQKERGRRATMVAVVRSGKGGRLGVHAEEQVEAREKGRVTHEVSHGGGGSRKGNGKAKA